VTAVLFSFVIRLIHTHTHTHTFQNEDGARKIEMIIFRLRVTWTFRPIVIALLHFSQDSYIKIYYGMTILMRVKVKIFDLECRCAIRTFLLCCVCVKGPAADVTDASQP
jgi:hypothetical protein